MGRTSMLIQKLHSLRCAREVGRTGILSSRNVYMTHPRKQPDAQTHETAIMTVIRHQKNVIFCIQKHSVLLF